MLVPQECLDTYTVIENGRLYACPGQQRLRSILGMMAFAGALPDGTASVFFTEAELKDARRELATLRATDTDARPSILQSAWHVPLRWFVCFDDSERRIEQDGDHLRVRYLTTLEKASARVRDALDSLTGGIVHAAVVGMIYELREWLSTYPGDGVIELDYASVSTLFDPDELADDHSASDVWAAIHALADRDGMKAGLFYQRANDRWNKARQRGSLN